MRSKLSRGDTRLLAAGVALTLGSAATRYTHVGRVVPFIVSAVALGVLAATVGRSVDRLGDRLGSGMTGVVQSALGNLPELFFGIFALRAGLVGVVQAALIGSILANVLLVMGFAFIVGGLRHGTQRFSADSARIVVVLLVLAVSVLMIPTLGVHLDPAVESHKAPLSDLAAVVLLAVFVLAAPRSVRREVDEPGAGESKDPENSAPSASPAPNDKAGAAPASWSIPLVIAALLASSVAAAFVSDWFVAALSPALSAMHMSEAFAGLVVVAIAGNAVENVVGVQLAARNRSDYALSVILQSPVQIALVLIPALVLLSPVIGGAQLTLVLSPFLAVVLALTTLIAAVVVLDGESTWLEGACLVSLYVVIAASFWWG
ncbi:MAG: sodium:proton exchanger [Acidimicrobiales bacterium]|jgi:Ca2+:H+ antiporter